MSKFPLAALILSALLPVSATAATFHSVRVDYTGSGGPDQAADSLLVPFGTAPDREVFATIGARQSPYFAQASVDRSGNLGMEIRGFDRSQVRAQVDIASDEFFNPSGRQARVRSRVIVDGGLLRLLAPRASVVRLDVAVRTFQVGQDITRVQPDRNQFFALAGLAMQDDYANATLGATQDVWTVNGPTVGVGFEAEIPPQLVEIDLGLVAPNASLGIAYRSTLYADLFGPTEIGYGDYSDPLSVFFDNLTITPVGAAAPVPLPASLGLLLAGLAGLAGLCLRNPE